MGFAALGATILAAEASVRVSSWMVVGVGEPMRLEEREERPGRGEALVEVAGCGVCHTDLGFYYEGVPTRHPFPLALGHEISGKVVAAGALAEAWLGKSVIVPAVIPCGDCAACRAGRGSICPRQIFPGNDVHGGFGTHVRVPAHGLCEVPPLDAQPRGEYRVTLPQLSVIADAVSTPFQAVRRAGLEEGDLAVFVGVGGVGGFGVQIARTLGARVIAIDVDPERLAAMSQHGAALQLRPDELDRKALRKAVRRFAEEHEIPTWRWKIFETSGTPAGQSTAFDLVSHGSYLSIVGFTPERVSLRLSNLMAFDATAEGNWGCLPDLYPAVVELVLQGRIVLEPFVEERPMATINETFAALHERRISRRVILTPDDGATR